MAAKTSARRRRGRTAAKERASRSRRRLRLVWLVLLVSVAAYLYYQPLASYVETRDALVERQAQVDALRTAKAGLERRLESTASLEAAEREARRIGFVRPGEQLFVVKGIPDWRRAQRGQRAGG